MGPFHQSGSQSIRMPAPILIVFKGRFYREPFLGLTLCTVNVLRSLDCDEKTIVEKLQAEYYIT